MVPTAQPHFDPNDTVRERLVKLWPLLPRFEPDRFYLHLHDGLSKPEPDTLTRHQKARNRRHFYDIEANRKKLDPDNPHLSRHPTIHAVMVEDYVTPRAALLALGNELKKFRAYVRHGNTYATFGGWDYDAHYFTHLATLKARVDEAHNVLEAALKPKGVFGFSVFTPPYRDHQGHWRTGRQALTGYLEKPADEQMVDHAETTKEARALSDQLWQLGETLGTMVDAAATKGGPSLWSDRKLRQTLPEAITRQWPPVFNSRPQFQSIHDMVAGLALPKEQYVITQEMAESSRSQGEGFHLFLKLRKEYVTMKALAIAFPKGMVLSSLVDANVLETLKRDHWKTLYQKPYVSLEDFQEILGKETMQFRESLGLSHGPLSDGKYTELLDRAAATLAQQIGSQRDGEVSRKHSVGLG